MPTTQPPDTGRPGPDALAHAARDRLTVIRGRTYLLLRRLRRTGEVPAGRLEAGLVEIDRASRDLAALIERLEDGIDAPRNGAPPGDAGAD